MPIPQHTIANVFILAGLTGSGKTAIINHFIQTGQQALNIESLCRHDGSVFASLQYASQPGSYEFHKQLNKLWNSFDLTRPVFIEKELNKLGRIHLPAWLTHQINTAPVIWLNASQHAREKRIASFIQNANPTHFYNCLLKLDKKLGTENFRQATQLLQQGNYEDLAKILLRYYDHVPGYEYPADRVLSEIFIEDNDIAGAANRILAMVENVKKAAAIAHH